VPSTRLPHSGLPLPQSAPPSKRRRRSREAARAEILAAAESFLRERPFRELSVEEVMGRTSLSRSSFYVYFRDRHELLLRLVEEIGGQLFAVAERWFAGSGDAGEDVRVALEGVVAVYADHGPVMRAISDASSVDPEVETVYDGLVTSFVDATAVRLDEEGAARRTRALADRHDTAHALVWMTERYLSRSFGSSSPRVSRQTAANTLHEVWVRALYDAR
jgi:AcrR family transcriptional regulator